MKIIRILQVFTTMGRGGAESMIMNYYRHIDREKIQFDFLVHRKERAAFDDEIESLGGTIYRLSPINPIAPDSYYKELKSFFIKHPNYKVVHSHLNTFSCFPLKIAREFNIPCRIAHAHIAMDPMRFSTILFNSKNWVEAVKKQIKLQLKKRIHTDATHYFACGEKAGKWLFGSNTTFTIMNNAIDSNKFAFDPIISNNYKKRHSVNNEIVLGHIGRFTHQKNHSFLLRLFSQLLKENSNYRLLLIGDGPLQNKIKEEATHLNIMNKVIFMGLRTDIPELLQMIDIFVFPSFYEGLPVTLIEAQAAGVKVLASDTITTEVSLTNDIQFLTINESEELWANCILSLGEIKKKNNTALIKKGKYDIKANADKIQKFYFLHIK